MGAAVDPDAPARGGIALRRDAPRSEGLEVLKQQAVRRRDERAELVVGDDGHVRPRVDGFDEQHLALEHVADAGHDPLVEQRLGDLEVRPRAQSTKCFVSIELVTGQVRAK